MELPPPDPVPPSAWKGGKRTGERLTPEERMHIRDLYVDGCSYAEIERRTDHSRKTITAVISAERGDREEAQGLARR